MIHALTSNSFLTDAQGHRVDFRNTIVVLTSNLGSANILAGAADESSDGHVSSQTKAAVMEAVRAAYPPEFLNRIDEFIVFQRLSRAALRAIVDIRLRELQARLDDRRITLEVGESVKQWLCDKGYDPRYGARPLNRLISREIGNGLADRIIRGEVRTGQTASVEIRKDGEGLDVVGAA